MAATQIDSLCPQVSLIHFVFKANILDLVYSSLHVTHSLPCPLSSSWKVLLIIHGRFRFCLFQKELLIAPVFAKLL